MGFILPGQVEQDRLYKVRKWDLASGSVLRFNKLGLDHLSLGEEPVPNQQVEEALIFTPLGSAPLDQEPLLSVDLGTAHSAAVTGKEGDMGVTLGPLSTRQAHSSPPSSCPSSFR